MTDWSIRTKAWLAGLSSAWVFTAACFLITVRNPLPIFRPELWAEDGTIFFADAFNFGPAAFFHPVFSSFHVIGRGIALISSILPTFYIPLSYAVASLLLLAGAAAYFARESFAWILPHRELRIVAALAILTCGIGASEVQMNLCNLIYVAGLWMTLLSLERPISNTTCYLLFWILLSLSSPLFMPFLAFHGLNWIIEKDRRSFKIAVVLLPGLVLALIAGALHIWDYPSSLVNEPMPVTAVQSCPPFDLIRIWFERFFLHTFFLSPLGPNRPGDLLRMPSIFWMLAIICLGLAVYGVKKDRRWLRFFLLCFCLSGTFALQAMTRPGALANLIHDSWQTLFRSRYSFIFGFLNSVLLIRIAFDLIRARHRAWGYALTALLTINFIEAAWATRPRRPTLITWPAFAAEMDTLRANLRIGRVHPPQISPPLPVHPDSWSGRKFIMNFPN